MYITVAGSDPSALANSSSSSASSRSIFSSSSSAATVTEVTIQIHVLCPCGNLLMHDSIIEFKGPHAVKQTYFVTTSSCHVEEQRRGSTATDRLREDEIAS